MLFLSPAFFISLRIPGLLHLNALSLVVSLTPTSVMGHLLASTYRIVRVVCLSREAKRIGELKIHGNLANKAACLRPPSQTSKSTDCLGSLFIDSPCHLSLHRHRHRGENGSAHLTPNDYQQHDWMLRGDCVWGPHRKVQTSETSAVHADCQKFRARNHRNLQVFLPEVR